MIPAVVINALFNMGPSPCCASASAGRTVPVTKCEVRRAIARQDDREPRHCAQRKCVHGRLPGNRDATTQPLQAHRIFERTVKHWPRIRLTIRQRMRVLDEWPRHETLL